MIERKKETQFNFARATKMKTKTKTFREEKQQQTFSEPARILSTGLSTTYTQCDQSPDMSSHYCALRFLLAFNAQHHIRCIVNNK